MESAGRGAAEEIRDWNSGLSAKRVLALCGQGGNGGDTLTVARWLGLWGADVRAVALGTSAGATEDEERAFAASFPGRLRSVREVAELGDVQPWLAEADLVLDGILGIGASQEARGLARAAIDLLADVQVPIVALDLPSGLLADSGAVPGPAVRAELTLAMGALKPCHLLPPAAEYCGKVRLVEVAYPPAAWDGTVPMAWIADAESCAGFLPLRPRFGHKGTFGRVLVVGGAIGMAGAVALAAEGALRAGAGLVHVLCPEPVFGIVAGLVLEALVHPGPAADGEFAPEAVQEVVRLGQEMDVVVIGPGLGRGPGPAELVRALLMSNAPLVADADALFTLAQDPKLLRRKHGELVLTPHPGEFARLVGAEAERVMADKIHWARRTANEYRAVVALKGPPTAISSPAGEVYLSTVGNTALAHGGSGDVLAGMVGGLWASGAEPLAAAVAGAYVHGLAAELATVGAAERAVLPSEILAALPQAFACLERRL